MKVIFASVAVVACLGLLKSVQAVPVTANQDLDVLVARVKTNEDTSAGLSTMRTTDNFTASLASINLDNASASPHKAGVKREHEPDEDEPDEDEPDEDDDDGEDGDDDDE